MQEQVKTCCSFSHTREAKEIALSSTSWLSEQKNKEVRFKEKMVYIKGGDFLMGCDRNEGHPLDYEGPVRKRRVEPFFMDSSAVTNEEFREFIKETGYRTEAENFGWSFVFYQFVAPDIAASARKVANTPWWFAVDGACWFQPEGPGSTIEDRMDHPVVHVSWQDATAFCRWARKRLPDEIEWEFAARGGLVQKRYPWGDELDPEKNHLCNIWQGKFPVLSTAKDGHHGTAPAESFPPNGFGLYNMVGNVWEWCSNTFTEIPGLMNSREFAEGRQGLAKAMRGGSYLCHESYCNRYRVPARSSNSRDSSAGNIGFRCVASV